MRKRGILSCFEEKQPIQPRATAAKKLLPEGGGQPSLAESSTPSLPVTVIDFSFLKPSFEDVKCQLFSKPVPFVIKKFIELFETGLSGVSLQWEDLFKDPLSSKLLDVSLIPEPVYTDLVQWVDVLMDDMDLASFVLWTFGYIVDSLFNCRPPLTATGGRERFQHSNVSILVAFAMILRNRSNVLYILRGSLMKKQYFYLNKGIVPTPLTVWLIAQVSQVQLHAAVFSWVYYLLPLLESNSKSTSDPHSTNLILQLAEKIMEKPEAKADLLAMPHWEGKLLIPPPSFEIMLQLRFPSGPAREEEDAARFARIYQCLKDVALASALKMEAVILDIFTVSLSLAGEGHNRVLAEEAAAIAIWSLTKNIDCWKLWNSLCKEEEYLKPSVALLKKLVEKWNDHSLSEEMKQQFVQQIFTVSLRLTGEGHSDLAKEGAAIAIWSLTESVDCWKRWENLYNKENIGASVALLRELVEKLNDPSLKLLSSPSDTLSVSQTMKSFRLKNKKANGYLFKEADKSCKVISGRVAASNAAKLYGYLSCGSSSLKSSITAAVLVIGVGATLVLSDESVFGFYR